MRGNSVHISARLNLSDVGTKILTVQLEIVIRVLLEFASKFLVI